MTMFLTPTRSHAPLTPRRLLLIVGLMSLLLVGAMLTSLSIGSVSVPLRDVFGALLGQENIATVSRSIVIDIRLPRVLLAIIVGGGLSIAGLVLQALLRNPLAEPYILGISSGGTLGAILAVALAWGPIGTPAASFAGSAAVMLLVYLVAHRRGQLDTYTLLLAGVMIGAFFNAVILLVIALFNQELHNAFLWLMGNLSGAANDSLVIITPFVALAAVFFLFHAKDYNLVSTGEETASQLGVHVKGLKRSSYIAASLITGLVVSVSGVVGFVGLIIPHICRLLFGPDHRLLLPVSAIMGAFFLVCADLLARTLIAPAEIPVGAVTAAIGAPVFVYLLRTR